MDPFDDFHRQILQSFDATRRQLVDLQRPRDLMETVRFENSITSSLQALQSAFRFPLFDSISAPGLQLTEIDRFVQEAQRIQQERDRIFDVVFKEISERSEKRVLVCRGIARLGWWSDIHLAIELVDDLVGMLNASPSDDSAVNSRLVEHFRCRLEEIREEALAAYPHRKAPIEQALDAIVDGKSYVAIPTLLAQADGIFIEVTGVDLYGATTLPGAVDAPKAAARLNGKVGITLAALREFTMINMPKRLRTAPVEFSRHATLHGEDSAYGTEVNAFRAVAVLNWVLQNAEKLK